MRSILERMFPSLHPARARTPVARDPMPPRPRRENPGRSWEATNPYGWFLGRHGWYLSKAPRNSREFYRETCQARTKSEARAVLKKRLGFKDRLPVGTVVR